MTPPKLLSSIQRTDYAIALSSTLTWAMIMSEDATLPASLREKARLLANVVDEVRQEMQHG